MLSWTSAHNLSMFRPFLRPSSGPVCCIVIINIMCVIINNVCSTLVLRKAAEKAEMLTSCVLMFNMACEIHLQI